MDAQGIVEAGLGRARLEGDGQALDLLAGIRPTMWQPSTWSLSASTTSFIRVRSCTSVRLLSLIHI